ncbi:hypothetical protein E2C01_068742 [Portunus trituberculatus]|uniref:Uncharacterized protein n=1 Tax=Portunus trituberculatus TaxID=210409 RepID=A0A5B7I0Y2_PORTR|nr:hypothetical protein [Portunus trituberculatus]
MQPLSLFTTALQNTTNPLHLLLIGRVPCSLPIYSTPDYVPSKSLQQLATLTSPGLINFGPEP